MCRVETPCAKYGARVRRPCASRLAPRQGDRTAGQAPEPVRPRARTDPHTPHRPDTPTPDTTHAFQLMCHVETTCAHDRVRVPARSVPGRARAVPGHPAARPPGAVVHEVHRQCAGSAKT